MDRNCTVIITDTGFSSGNVLAIYIPKQFRQKGLTFHSDGRDGLQFATYIEDKNYSIPAHIHFDRTLVVKDVNEVIYVEKGKVQVDLYGKYEVTQQRVILYKGDTIVLLSGGHGFKFLKKSTLIYVKQGPYVSKERDKRLL